MTATPPASKKTPAKEIVTLSIAAAKAKLTPAALEAVKTWLGEQFLANMYAKLGQGGDEEGHIALRQVFVDLPVGLEIDDETGEETRGGFLESFLAAKPIKLGLIARTEQSLPKIEADEQELQINIPRFSGKQYRNDRLSATLLIGGPGQGKSTLGQLACQLHRAALLLPFSTTLSMRHQELIASFQTPAANASTAGKNKAPDLVPPKKPFLPLQISLPELAAWLAQKTPPSPSPIPLILQFLAERPSAQLCKLEAGTLLALTAHIPILLVLDGFDEVGAGQDRQRLVLAARELLDVLQRQAAEVQLLATTRPQGYAGELAHIGIPLHPCQLELLKLEEALHYAEKLVNAKPLGADDRYQILARLKEAANEPTTKRLLTTPLQVTILSSLVQQAGRAPRERWNLFEKYFSYTYNREIIHNTYASNLLHDHRQHIIQIHARVALLLQVESERDGGAAARMSQQRLEEVINEVLLEDGIADDDRLALVREITVAAGQRLVFLVEPEPGSFGFEIRSLQEFMAAWALTSGRESELEERLHTVARAAMFRNVTLFIASKFFSEGSVLRDIFADSICPGINNDAQDELARQTYAGSLLALEILEEGAVLMQPNRARALMVCACELLLLPPTGEHLRLFKIANNKDIYPVLHRALEQTLSQANQPDQQLTAWYCLLMAIEHKRDGALAMADHYWPKLTAPRLLLQDLTKQGMNIGPWLSDKIAQNPEEFSPIDFIRASTTTGNNWVGWLSGVFMNRQSRFIRAGWHGFSVTQLNKKWTTEPKAATLPTAWLPWVFAARFELAPNAKKLSVALLNIADALPQTEWKKLQNRASWPLAVCLRTANTPDDLRKFAQQAQAGVLGDATEWLSAEKSWEPPYNWPSMAKLITLWTLKTLKHQSPLFILQDDDKAAHFQRYNLNNNFLANIDKALEATASHNLQNWLVDFCKALIDIGTLDHSKSEPYLQKWFYQFKQLKTCLIPRPAFLPHHAWMEALDAVADINMHYYGGEASMVFKVLDEAEGHPKVLRLFIKTIWRHHDFFNEIPSFMEIKHFLTKFKQQNTTSAGADWKMLQLYVGMSVPEQDDALFKEIEAAALHDPVLWIAFLKILELAQLSQGRLGELLGKLWTIPNAKKLIGSKIINLMRKQLETRKSGLDNHTTWNRLALPLPHPLKTQTQAQQTALPACPVHITSLELKNIRALHQLKLTFPPTPENCGQWVVVLGQNGVGKTTLLRSLALVLRNAANRAIWPKGVFSNNWLRTPDNKEAQIDQAEILLTLSNGTQNTILIRHSDITGTNTNQYPDQEHSNLLPLFGYGCRRGSALAGGSREVKLSANEGPEISTLFDDDADLIHAETWLRILESDAQKDAQYKIIFETVIAALIKFLDLTDLEIKIGGGVWITEKTGLKLPFKDLSDGYLTSAGWFLDLIARWIELGKQRRVIFDGDFMNQMRGLVLIDEIDLHLHPRWQIEIIDRTRKLLPQMSFIVTTHNPLTLVGAKAQEIWILERENGRIQARSQSDTPMLLTGGQIYRRFFGIEDIYPNGLGAALQRYSFLTGFALRTDDEEAELARLQTQLEEANIKPDWDIVPRQMIAPPAPTNMATQPPAPAKPRTKKAKAPK